MLLLVTSTVRTSNVSSSMPLSGHCNAQPRRARMGILRQIRRLGPPFAGQHMFACVRGVLAGIPLAFTFGFDPCAVH